MKFRLFNNEKGLTLVELLAALSLFVIVIALSSTVIIQLVNSEEKASQNITLKQDANVLIHEMQTDYLKKSKDVEIGDTFSLCFDENDNIKITELKLNGDRFEINGGCTQNPIENQETLNVELTVKNYSNEEFSIITAWNNKNNFDLTVNSTDGNENESNFPSCEIRGSIVLENLKLNKEDCKRYTLIGSLVVRGQTIIEEGVSLHIHGSAHFQGNIDLNNKAQIITSGSAQYDDKIFCEGIEVSIKDNKSTIHCKN